MAPTSLVDRLKALPLASALLVIRGYQLLVSPLMGARCRYYPCCSNYALEALRLHGCARGTWLAAKRIARCHPYSSGGLDPVPALKTCHPK
jgi:putative membrane protein insertion efficiency factor